MSTLRADPAISTSPNTAATRPWWRRALDVVDDRLGITALTYPVPEHANNIAWSLGGITAAALVLLVVTGILLTQFYAPVPEEANASVRHIVTHEWGMWFVRGVHFWAAQAMYVTAALHLLRVFLTGSYKRPREGNWLIGVAMFGLVIFALFTGTVLKWDQEGYEALGHNVEVANLLGGGGLWFSPDFANRVSILIRLYSAHVVLIPGLIVVLFTHLPPPIADRRRRVHRRAGSGAGRAVHPPPAPDLRARARPAGGPGPAGRHLPTPSRSGARRGHRGDQADVAVLVDVHPGELDRPVRDPLRRRRPVHHPCGPAVHRPQPAPRVATPPSCHDNRQRHRGGHHRLDDLDGLHHGQDPPGHVSDEGRQSTTAMTSPPARNGSARRARSSLWILLLVATLAAGSLSAALSSPGSPATGLRVAVSGIVLAVTLALAARVFQALHSARSRSRTDRHG